jgi:hypothetical protein
MKLQKQLSRVSKGKKYPKYALIISPKDIERLGWKEGIMLDRKIKGKYLILRPKTS